MNLPTSLLAILFIHSFQVLALPSHVDLRHLPLKRLPHQPLNDVTFTCPIPNGLFPIPENNCGVDYYVCVAGFPYFSSCPAGATFDPVNLKCTLMKNAACRSTFTCPQSDGFFPIPGTCGNDYYSCIGGVAYPEKCPGSSVFDPVDLVCKLPEEATCSATTTTNEPTTSLPPTTTPGLSFTCPPVDGFYAVPGNCTGQFYICLSGNHYVQNCPGTSIFDPVLGICVPASLASCTITTTVRASTERTTTTTPEETTTTRTTTTEVPTTTTQTSTIQLTTTTTKEPITSTSETPSTAPTTTTTEAPTSTTEPSTTVRTTTTTVPTTTTTSSTVTTTTSQTTTTTLGPFVCPQPFGLYPVPGMACSPDFYHCSNYYAYLKTCPATTYFNPLLEVCDYPENIAGCL